MDSDNLTQKHKCKKDKIKNVKTGNNKDAKIFPKLVQLVLPRNY